MNIPAFEGLDFDQFLTDEQRAEIDKLNTRLAKLPKWAQSYIQDLKSKHQPIVVNVAESDINPGPIVDDRVWGVPSSVIGEKWNGISKRNRR